MYDFAYVTNDERMVRNDKKNNTVVFVAENTSEKHELQYFSHEITKKEIGEIEELMLQ